MAALRALCPGDRLDLFEAGDSAAEWRVARFRFLPFGVLTAGPAGEEDTEIGRVDDEPRGKI